VAFSLATVDIGRRSPSGPGRTQSPPYAIGRAYVNHMHDFLLTGKGNNGKDNY